MKKYELTKRSKANPLGRDYPPLYQIRALRDIPRQNVKAGDMGGWIESEESLSHSGDCWVFEDSYVSRQAQVSEDACVRGESIIDFRAKVKGRVIVSGSRIQGVNTIEDEVVITHSKIGGQTELSGTTRVDDSYIECVVSPFNATIVSSDVRGVGTKIELPAGSEFRQSKLQTTDPDFHVSERVIFQSVEAMNATQVRVLEKNAVLRDMKFPKETPVKIGSQWTTRNRKDGQIPTQEEKQNTYAL